MNNRIEIYKFLYDLLKNLNQSKSEEEYFLNYKKLLAIIMRLSDSHIRSEGEANFKEEFIWISKLYMYSCSLTGNSYIPQVQDFVINDLLDVAQKFRMFSKMFPEAVTKEMTYELFPILGFIFDFYLIARSKKNTVAEEFHFFVINDLEQKKDMYSFAFELAKILFDPIHDLNKHFYLTYKQKQDIIKKLIELGPYDKFPLNKFMSAMNVLIAQLVMSNFKFEGEAVFHVTTLSNFKNICESNETWIRKTNKLNDPKEQKYLIEYLSESEIKMLEFNETDLNNEYVSLSMTSEFPNNDIIKVYSGDKKNAIVVNFERFNTNSIFTSFSIKKIMNRKIIWNFKPFLGLIIYDLEKMLLIWENIKKFIEELECAENFKKNFQKKAINILKMFYKDEKWAYEKELRLIIENPIASESFNFSEDETFFKFKCSNWMFFKKISIYDQSFFDNLIDIVKKDDIAKESFLIVEEKMKHYNFSKSIISDIKEKIEVIID